MPPILSLTIDASFEGKKIYTLEEDIQPGGAVKYRMIFDRSQYHFYQTDLEKIEKEVDTVTVKRTLDDLMKTPVSICPEEVCGLDGSMTTIEIERGMNQVRYSWWGDLPKEWKNLGKILAFFDIEEKYWL